jgi:hypothetical protein
VTAKRSLAQEVASERVVQNAAKRAAVRIYFPSQQRNRTDLKRVVSLLILRFKRQLPELKEC